MISAFVFAIDLVAILKPEADALGPEIARAEDDCRASGSHERRRWIDRVGDLAAVDDAIDLVAGPDHVAHEQDVVAHPEAPMLTQVDAQLQPYFRDEGELVMLEATDVRRQGQNTAIQVDGRAAGGGNGLAAIDVDDLRHVAQGDFRRAANEPVPPQAPLEVKAHLGAVEDVTCAKTVVDDEVGPGP